MGGSNYYVQPLYYQTDMQQMVLTLWMSFVILYCHGIIILFVILLRHISEKINNNFCFNAYELFLLSYFTHTVPYLKKPRELNTEIKKKLCE